MKKRVVLLLMFLLAFVSLVTVNAEETPYDRIIEFTIHVLSHKVDIKQENESIKTVEAATASPKNARELSRKNPDGVPYGKIGEITKIVFNPPWSPTKNIRKEEYAKTGKWLPEIVPPGKDNPLGKIKLFISFDENNSSLGIHNTNKPKSIGKRVTHGCVRFGEANVFETARIILEQNGYDTEEIFKKAAENPKKTFSYEIYDRPSVIFLKD